MVMKKMSRHLTGRAFREKCIFMITESLFSIWIISF